MHTRCAESILEGGLAKRWVFSQPAIFAIWAWSSAARGHFLGVSARPHDGQVSDGGSASATYVPSSGGSSPGTADAAVTSVAMNCHVRIAQKETSNDVRCAVARARGRVVPTLGNAASRPSRGAPHPGHHEPRSGTGCTYHTTARGASVTYSSYTGWSCHQRPT